MLRLAAGAALAALLTWPMHARAQTEPSDKPAPEWRVSGAAAALEDPDVEVQQRAARLLAKMRRGDRLTEAGASLRIELVISKELKEAGRPHAGRVPAAPEPELAPKTGTC